MNRFPTAYERSHGQQGPQYRHAHQLSGPPPGKARFRPVRDWRRVDAHSPEYILPHVAQAGPNCRISPRLKRDFPEPHRVSQEFEGGRRVVEQVPWQLESMPITAKQASLSRVHVGHQDIENSPWFQPLANAG